MKKIKKLIIILIFFLPVIHTGKIDIKTILHYMSNKKIRGFLNVIACCEGTKKINRKNKASDHLAALQEYKIPFINAEKITSLIEYPNKLFCGNVRQVRVCASASGRYQFIRTTWAEQTKKNKQQDVFKKHEAFFDYYLANLPHFYQDDVIALYKNKTDIIKNKFGPFWQDFYAIILLEKAGAIQDILNNNYSNAIKKACKVWSTLPKDKSGKSFYEDHINRAQKFDYTIKLCQRYIS
jgi:muramidase (phage lysozyme)